MSQNRSSAVMQQRAEPADSLDDFPTPPWATRALCRFLIDLGHDLGAQAAWEPCCNRMHMVKPMREHFAHVRASDVHPYGEHELIDFATTGATEPMVDWVFANPPFRLAEEFIATALKVARVGVAMLVRGAFTEGAERWRTLFSKTPPSYELKFTERVVMLKGRLIRAGAPDPFSMDEHGAPRKASTATSYVWLVWLPGWEDGDTRARWVPPCRVQLERPGDYPSYPGIAPPAADGEALLV